MSTSHLPPELWLHIFSLATHVPCAFAPSDHHTLFAFSRDTYGIGLYNRLRAAMNTKLALCLVCRSWRSLVNEIIFEYMRITSGDQALCLATLAEKNTALHHIARRAQRLDLALEGVHIWTEVHSAALRRLIRCCENLNTFSTMFCTAEEYLYIDALQDLKHCKNIRRIELRTSLVVSKRIIAGLSGTVETMWISPLKTPNNLPESPKVLLPLLHTLVQVPCPPDLTDGCGIADHLDVPALTTLITDDADTLVSLLPRYGNQFLCVSIPRSLREPQHWTVPCPNLRQIIINCADPGPWCLRTSQPHIYATISRIVVEEPAFLSPCNFLSSQTLSKFLDQLTSPETFPNLDSLRLLLPLSYHEMHNNDAVKTSMIPLVHAWLLRCEQQGIRVEYSRGIDDQATDSWTSLDPDALIQSLYEAG